MMIRATSNDCKIIVRFDEEAGYLYSLLKDYISDIDNIDSFEADHGFVFDDYYDDKYKVENTKITLYVNLDISMSLEISVKCDVRMCSHLLSLINYDDSIVTLQAFKKTKQFKVLQKDVKVCFDTTLVTIEKNCESVFRPKIEFIDMID